MGSRWGWNWRGAGALGRGDQCSGVGPSFLLGAEMPTEGGGCGREIGTICPFGFFPCLKAIFGPIQPDLIESS